MKELITAQTVAPDFTAEWRQIREDLADLERLDRDRVALWLRVGQALRRIREGSPHGQWLAKLAESGLAATQASYYTAFAKIPEEERGPLVAACGSNLRRVVESWRSKNPPTPSGNFPPEENPAAQVPSDELADRLAEIDQRLKLAVEIVSRGEEALAGETQPAYADDDARWKHKVSEIAADVLTVISTHLKKELERRFPCR